jgi:hypothetical protein
LENGSPELIGNWMRQSVSAALYTYWDCLKGARAAPERADIDPSAIRHLLRDAFFLEIDPGGGFPIRLSGTRFGALRLGDQEGGPFLALWREEDRRSVAGAIGTVADGVVPIVAGVRSGMRGHDALDFELLLLPLRHFGRTHSLIMGSLTPLREPCLPGLEPVGLLSLVSMRIMRETEKNSFVVKNGNRYATSRVRRAPRLIVYEGGKSIESIET